MEEAMVALLETESDGIDVNEIGTRLGRSPQEGQDALNKLLAAHRVELVQVGLSLRVKIKREERSDLTAEERLLLSFILDANSKGIWIRSLRDNSGLSHVQIRKALKTLEQKKLIKAVKAVGTTKKSYMGFDVVEDVALTGGTFYSDRQIDSELVQSLMSVCVTVLTARRKESVEKAAGDYALEKAASYTTVREMATFVRERKILHVPITDDDMERIIQVAELDGIVTRRMDGAVRLADCASRASPLVSVPCALCPLSDDCAPGKEINPTSCQYYNDWLSC